MALNDDDRATLSAYLDGELDDDATHQIEVRLTQDPELRVEYDTLRQTWSLLDYLPRTSPSVEFTNRTLAQVTLERQSASASWISRAVRRVPTLTAAWVAGVLLAAGVGIAVGGWLTVPPDDGNDEDAWLKAQPRAVQVQIAALAGAERHGLIDKLRAEERERHEAWQAAAKAWDQVRQFADLKSVDQEGVRDYLLPFLSPQEKERLQQAEGAYPDYARTLVELADKHPLALQGKFGPTTFAELPQAVQKRFARPINAVMPTGVALLRQRGAEGAWPKLAIATVEINQMYSERDLGPLPRELWACNYKNLLKPMQNYIDDVLRPGINDDEKERLTKAGSRWPDYPQTIQDLAEEKRLPRPPWNTALSGPEWDAYRVVKVNTGPR